MRADSAESGPQYGIGTASLNRVNAAGVRGAVTSSPDETDHRVMQLALADGRAATPIPAVTDIARYDDAWWLFERGSWLLVTDAAVAAGLDALIVRAARW